jgi:hypothetical protein
MRESYVFVVLLSLQLGSIFMYWNKYSKSFYSADYFDLKSWAFERDVNNKIYEP